MTPRARMGAAALRERLDALLERQGKLREKAARRGGQRAALRGQLGEAVARGDEEAAAEARGRLAQLTGELEELDAAVPALERMIEEQRSQWQAARQAEAEAEAERLRGLALQAVGGLAAEVEKAVRKLAPKIQAVRKTAGQADAAQDKAADGRPYRPARYASDLAWARAPGLLELVRAIERFHRQQTGTAPVRTTVQPRTASTARR